MASETAIVAKEEKEMDIVKRLAEWFPETERPAIVRDIWLVLQNKSLTWKDEDGKNIKVRYNSAQAMAYVMACRDLQLNPIMSHVIMLEDQFYITLQGHLQNAHQTGSLVGLKTELLSSGNIEYVKKGYKGGADTKKTAKQFRYRCIILRKIGDTIAEFSAEGVADASNVAGGEYASDLKIEQMAEARAMRRTLARAFPAGLSNIEDVQEAQAVENINRTVESEVAEATKDELLEKIQNATSKDELAGMKDEIKKSKDNKYVQAYSVKLASFLNPTNNEQSDTDQPEQA